MLASAIPTKIAVPFGNSAGGSYIRPIPVASQIGVNAGYASYTDGFVPLNMTPIGAGGVPPFGQDMNGILNAITKWNQWYNAGGAIPYDATFSSSVGGYPKGAIVASVTMFGREWLSTVDNNTSNPDTGGANWASINSALRYASDTGAVNAYVCTYTPPLTTHIPGLIIGFAPGNTNTGASTFNPGPGVKAISYSGSAGATPLLANMLHANTIAYVSYDGTEYQLLNPIFIPLGTTNTLATFSGGSAPVGGFATWNGVGNLVDGGLTGSGNATKVLLVSGVLTGTKILRLDGSGNAEAVYSPTGNQANLLTISGSLSSTDRIITVDGSGNGVDSGYSPASFDAAGSASSALASANAHSDALAAWTWSGGATLALGQNNFNHNLGFDQLRCGVRVAISCQTADAGYSVGDVIYLFTSGPANSSNNMLTVYTDAAGNNTAVLIGVGLTVAHASTFAATNLTLSRWLIYIGVTPNH